MKGRQSTLMQKKTDVKPDNKHSFRIVDKMAKTKVLWADHKLREYIPLTHMLTKESLQTMLLRYGMVYVKPKVGALGRGVMKAEMSKGSEGGRAISSYSYQHGEKK